MKYSLNAPSKTYALLLFCAETYKNRTKTSGGDHRDRLKGFSIEVYAFNPIRKFLFKNFSFRAHE